MGRFILLLPPGQATGNIIGAVAADNSRCVMLRLDLSVFIDPIRYRTMIGGKSKTCLLHAGLKVGGLLVIFVRNLGRPEYLVALTTHVLQINNPLNTANLVYAGPTAVQLF